MRKILTALIATAALAFAAAAPAGAAQVGAGSCGWDTTPGVWHYSPAYGVSEEYVGHAIYSGRYFRRFLVYSPVSGQYDYWDKYCG